jgi:predicted ribosome quality control (RQC) complex YloA/Tae2 family protein
MRRKILLLALCLGGCAAAPATTPVAPAPRAESNLSEDRDAAAALLVGNIFQSMQRLTQAPPAEQAEVLSTARAAFERAPQGTVQLRYAMLLSAPAHPGRDLTLAQTLLRQLIAQPETLVPVERAVATVELATIDRELSLKADTDRVQVDAQRGDRERSSASQKRLQAEVDENARLRKQLEDAQAKLDAIANIERNLTPKTPGEGRPQ